MSANLVAEAALATWTRPSLTADREDDLLAARVQRLHVGLELGVGVAAEGGGQARVDAEDDLARGGRWPRRRRPRRGRTRWARADSLQLDGGVVEVVPVAGEEVLGQRADGAAGGGRARRVALGGLARWCCTRRPCRCATRRRPGRRPWRCAGDGGPQRRALVDPVTGHRAAGGAPAQRDAAGVARGATGCRACRAPRRCSRWWWRSPGRSSCPRRWRCRRRPCRCATRRRPGRRSWRSCR